MRAEGPRVRDLPLNSAARSAAPFGVRLRNFRLRAGLSQEALAERAGLGVATLRALERGQRQQPHAHTLARLVEALGLSPAERATLLEPVLEPSAPVTTSDAPATALVRLPVPPTALIGREAELAEVCALLHPNTATGRLVTLVGPAGVGKTRLALAAASILTDAYSDGVVFVDLASLHDARLVPATIAHALGVQESRGRSARELVLEYLRERQLLLLLDNFEQVLPAAQLLPDLLVHCPSIALVVTSRAALRLRVEQRFRVEPLATPGLKGSVEAIAASPAVRLFIERAQTVAPDFVLDATSARDVATICSRLDGLPLAIELAAARVGLLKPAALLRRLEQRLPLLGHGAVDLPERQQTLSTTLTWSSDLLDSQAQVLFRRLAVFVGGWTLDAAEAVAADGEVPAASVLDGSQVLVESSLVRPVTVTGSDPRFEMLETVREYAVGCLRESGEQATIRDRHLNYYLSLAEQATVELFGPRLAASLASLDRDRANLRAALDWAWEQRQVTIGLRLAGALGPFWSTRGYASEGRAQFSRLLAAMDNVDVPASERARAMYGAGVLANGQGDQQQALEWLDRAVALSREAGDAVNTVRALNTRGGVDYDRGDLHSAMARYTECISLARAANDQGEVARALGNLGEVYYHLDELARAEACHEEALALAKRAGRVDIEAYQLSDLANVARRLGDVRRAASLHRQALALKRTLGDHRRIAISLEEMAALSAAEGRMDLAARWLGAATELRATIGTPLPVPERIATEHTIAAARAALGEEVWMIEFMTGRGIPLSETIADALDEHTADAGGAALASLNSADG